MTRQQMLLTILMEECNETAQRASKAIRFGLEEVQEGQPLTNADRIIYEFNDIVAIMQIMCDEGHFATMIDVGAVNKKVEKVEKWLKYSCECGMIGN